MFCRRCCEIADCEFNFSATTTGSDPLAASSHDRICYGEVNFWTPKWKLETASSAEVNHVNKRSSNIHGSSNPLQMRFPIHRRRGSNHPTNDKLSEARNSTRTSASFASRRCAVIYDSTTSLDGQMWFATLHSGLPTAVEHPALPPLSRTDEFEINSRRFCGQRSRDWFPPEF